MLEFFYADKIDLSARNGLMSFYNGSNSVKSQAFSHYNFFGQVSYPLNPIISASLAGMYFYDKRIDAIYVGPGLDISLGNNLTLSAYLQLFYYKIISPYSSDFDWDNSNFAYVRYKWNF